MGLGFVAGPLARSAAVCRKSFVFSSFQFFTYKKGLSFAFCGGASALRFRWFLFCFQRVIHRIVAPTTKDEHGKATVNAVIADSTAFWWNPKRPDQPSLWDSRIELSEKFFNEIIRQPVPLDMNTLKALKRSSLGLDLYLWLTYRTFAIRAPQRITWKQVYRQFGSAPDRASDNVTVQNFRREVLRELKKIKLAWKDLNYTTASGFLILRPSTPKIAPINQGQLIS